MYEHTDKNEFITYIYKKYQESKSILEDTYTVPFTIEKYLTDEIFNFIIEKHIHIDIEELHLFCLVDAAIKIYDRDIKRFDKEDYNIKIKTLKKIADKIQYYSSEQIEIILPIYPLPSHFLIKLFTNIMILKYDKETMNKFLKFWNQERFQATEIDLDIEEKIYRPKFENSYTNILKNVNLWEDGASSYKQRDMVEKVKKIINSNADNKTFYPIEGQDDYEDINSLLWIREEIDKLLTYDTAVSVDYLDNKLDLFSIWRFLDTVKNYKFLLKSDLDATDSIKFKKKIKTLKHDVDTLQNYSKSSIKIDIPLYSNVNFSLMQIHLLERGVRKEDIRNLFGIFDRNRLISPTNYSIEKEKILTDAMSLTQLHHSSIINPIKNNTYHSDAKHFINELEFSYTSASYSDKIPADIHQEYIEKLLKIISLFASEVNFIDEQSYKEKIIKNLTIDEAEYELVKDTKGMDNIKEINKGIIAMIGKLYLH